MNSHNHNQNNKKKEINLWIKQICLNDIYMFLFAKYFLCLSTHSYTISQYLIIPFFIIFYPIILAKMNSKYFEKSLAQRESTNRVNALEVTLG